MFVNAILNLQIKKKKIRKLFKLKQKFNTQSMFKYILKSVDIDTGIRNSNTSKNKKHIGFCAYPKLKSQAKYRLVITKKIYIYIRVKHAGI